MTLDELKARAKADLDNAFEKGKAQGGGGDVAQNPLYYATALNNTWGSATFPEGFDCVVEFKNAPTNLNSAFMRATGVKTVTLICNAEGVAIFNQLIRDSAVEVLDLSKFKPTPSTINYFLYGNNSITTIMGEFDLSNCTSATYAFNVSPLKDIRFKEGTVGISLQFNDCKSLSAESYDSIMQGLSSTATGQTLTLTKYATVKATYNAKYGDAWDILTAEKTNWTIAYR
jgi:hypothetical protein